MSDTNDKNPLAGYVIVCDKPLGNIDTAVLHAPRQKIFVDASQAPTVNMSSSEFERLRILRVTAKNLIDDVVARYGITKESQFTCPYMRQLYKILKEEFGEYHNHD